MEQPQVYIRVDASPEIGLGHFMRQTHMAQAFLHAGAHVTLLMQSMTPLVYHQSLDGCHTIRLHDPDAFLLEATKQPRALVIVDLGQVNQDRCHAIQERAPVVQFDPKEALPAANLVVFPSLHRFPRSVMFYDASGILTGTRHLIIPPRWATRRRYLAEAREPYLVITAGGGDSIPLLNQVAEIARTAPWGRQAVLMVGDQDPHVRQKINRNTPAVWRPWEPTWLFAARLAVVPLGQTLYETLFAWTPLMTWARTDADQALLPNLQTYDMLTAPVVDPWHTAPDQWADAIQQAWEHTAWQQQAIRTAQSLDIPTDGAARIARACLQLLT